MLTEQGKKEVKKCATKEETLRLYLLSWEKALKNQKIKNSK
jgi:hypothetical protein